MHWNRVAFFTCNTMLLVLFLAVTAATVSSVLLYLHLTRHFKYWKNQGIAFIKPIPFFGNAHKLGFLQTSASHFIENLYKSTISPYIGFFIFDQPYLLVRDLELIKLILIKDFDHFDNRTTARNMRDDAVGSSMLFSLENPTWKSVRVKITPAFTSGKIKNMTSQILQTAEEMKTFIYNIAVNSSVTDCRNMAMKYSSDVVLSCSFGILGHSFENDHGELNKATSRIFHPSVSRSLQIACYFFAHTLVKPFRMRFVDPKSTQFLQQVFLDQMDQRQQTKTTRGDMIDILVHLKETGAVNETAMLLAQALQFFVAGVETMGASISFALYELAKNADIQQKLRIEIKSMLETYDGITYKSLQEIPLLTRVIKETLRMYPPLPFLDRRCSKRYAIPNTNHVLDEGIPVYISLLGLHYDPEYYPNPHQFDPDRFTQENELLIPNFAYMPFGDGPRNCIGSRLGMLTVQVGLVQILSNFVVEPCSTTPIPMVKSQTTLTLAPLNGLDLRFRLCET